MRFSTLYLGDQEKNEVLELGSLILTTHNFYLEILVRLRLIVEDCLVLIVYGFVRVVGRLVAQLHGLR